jgi:gluconokinase
LKSSEPLALSLDIGTSSCRALLWDAAGREAVDTSAQLHYSMHTTPDGGVEMPAEELLNQVNACIDRALDAAQSAGRVSDIAAIGVSTFWHSMLGIDKYGNAVTPIYSWADTRAAESAIALKNRLDSSEIHRRTGCTLHPSYYPARLTWLYSLPATASLKIWRWVSPSEYLLGQWFGVQAIDVSVSMASGTGLFMQESQTWDAELCAAIGLDPQLLSPIVDLDTPASGLLFEYATRWPALRDTPFFPAVGDGACGNIGSGCTNTHRLAINLGTSGAIRAVWNQVPGEAYAAPPTGLWRYRVDAHRPIIGAAFSDGGHVYSWMARSLNLAGMSPEMLDETLQQMQPGAHGLTFLPYLAGERSMGWNPEAKAGLFGLNLDTGPIDILRASMEAVALQFAAAAKSLQKMFPDATEIVASGGALGQSRAWQQMFADAIGYPLVLAAEPEASSRGAALLALQASGILHSTDDAPARSGKTVLPDAAAHQKYAEIQARQSALYEAIFTR